MILLLRFIGVMNAGIWFGSAVFVTVAAPVFFSEAVRATPLGKFWPGVMVQFVFERFFYLQCICGAIAIIHQLAEWVYLGRTLQRWVIIMLGILMLTGLLGGLILEPRLKHLNLVKHGLNEKYEAARYSPRERIQADKSFTTWHIVSRIVGVVTLAGLGLFFWKVVHPGENARFVSATKFRS